MEYSSESLVPYKNLENEGNNFHQPSAPTGLQAQQDMGQFQQSPNNIIMMQSPTVGPGTPAIGLPKNSVVMTCPTCHVPVKTKVNMNSTLKTHCCALACCLFTLVLCFWLPYCMKSCRRATHTCPNCGSYLGSSSD